MHTKIHRIDKFDKFYYIVLDFQLEFDENKKLLGIAKRQVQLIHELSNSIST